MKIALNSEQPAELQPDFRLLDDWRACVGKSGHRRMKKPPPAGAQREHEPSGDGEG